VFASLLQARGCGLQPYANNSLADWSYNGPQQLVGTLRVLDVGLNPALQTIEATSFSAYKLWELSIDGTGMAATSGWANMPCSFVFAGTGFSACPGCGCGLCSVLRLQCVCLPVCHKCSVCST
jgi:hypothetical protein